LKVLFVTSWYPSKLDPTNGNFVHRHALALISQGHEVVVIHEGFSNRILFPHIERMKVDGIVVYHLLLPRTLISLHGLRKLLATALLKKLKRDDIAFEIVHGHVLHPIGPIAAYIANKSGTPLVFTEHWSGFLPINAPKLNPEVIRMALDTAKACTALMPVSENLAKAMRGLGMRSKYEVVYNAVDPSLYFYKAKPNSEKFIFLHVSNFSKRAKNVEGIINAFVAFQKEHPGKADLVIAGDGDLGALKLHQAQNHPDAEAITYLGTQSYEEVAALMQKSHCFILFSNFENLPCVVAESLSCGIPVIATKVGGLSEMVDHTNGLLISPGDESALRSAMQSVVHNYDAYHGSFISNAALEKYGYKVISEQFEAVYRSALGNQDSL
jgi:glycosyltransferase involved in cell wall biosynthesis